MPILSCNFSYGKVYSLFCILDVFTELTHASVWYPSFKRLFLSDSAWIVLVFYYLASEYHSLRIRLKASRSQLFKLSNAQATSLLSLAAKWTILNSSTCIYSTSQIFNFSGQQYLIPNFDQINFEQNLLFLEVLENLIADLNSSSKISFWRQPYYI